MIHKNEITYKLGMGNKRDFDLMCASEKESEYRPESEIEGGKGKWF